MPLYNLAKLVGTGFDVALNQGIIGRVRNIINFCLATDDTDIILPLGEDLHAAGTRVKLHARKHRPR